MSLGESEVDCIGVGHGSCSVMRALVGQDCVCLCPCSASVSACLALRQTLEGENMGKAAMGPALVPGKEQGASARAGNGREQQASEREGTLQGGGGAHVLYDVTCHVEVSQQPARPPYGTTQTRLCTLNVALPHEAAVHATAPGWNGTCQTPPSTNLGSLHLHAHQWTGQDHDLKRAHAHTTRTQTNSCPQSQAGNYR